MAARPGKRDVMVGEGVGEAGLQAGLVTVEEDDRMKVGSAVMAKLEEFLDRLYYGCQVLVEAVVEEFLTRMLKLEIGFATMAESSAGCQSPSCVLKAIPVESGFGLSTDKRAAVYRNSDCKLPQYILRQP